MGTLTFTLTHPHTPTTIGQGLDGLDGVDLASLQGLDIPGLESLVKVSSRTLARSC